MAASTAAVKVVKGVVAIESERIEKSKSLLSSWLKECTIEDPLHGLTIIF